MSFQSSCYLLSSGTSPWSQAEQHCASHGGHLLVLNTVEELVNLSTIPSLPSIRSLLLKLHLKSWTFM